MLKLLNNRYALIYTLGSGGFGETFLAEDTHLPSKRRCVIKQLKPIVNNPQIYQLVTERFQREAAILEELGAECNQIPKLYAYFSENEKFYLVQEWIEGVTLSKQVQQQGRQPESFVKEILVKLLPVLDYVHGKKMVHRDIKPDNIMLRIQDDFPVLIDFGAVRETMATIINTQGNVSRSIVIGTPGYMPSEQAAGRAVYSSDLYSLGLTAIYLLTGKTPSELETDIETGEIIWREHTLNLSSDFAAALDKAIRPHSKERFTTAKEMLKAIEPNSILTDPTDIYPRSSPKEIPVTLKETPPPTDLELPKANKNSSKMILIGTLLSSGVIAASMIIGFIFNKSYKTNNEIPSQIIVETPQATPSPTLSNPLPNPPLPPPKLPFSSETTEDPQYLWLSEREVTEADLVGKTAQELDFMRNSIFARKGRQFDSPELQSYFDAQPWYKPRYSPQEFPNRLITPLEAKNALSILQYQERNNLRWIY